MNVSPDSGVAGRRAATRRPADRKKVRRPGSRKAPDKKTAKPGLPAPLLALIVAWPIPWTGKIAGLEFSPYRFVLLATLLPSLFWWLGGRAGRKRFADFAIIGFALWCALSLSVVHGAGEALKSGGTIVLETVGPYLLARTLVRTPEAFYGMVRALFWVVVLIMPFALVEVVTRQDVLLKLFGSILPAHPVINSEARWGLRRAQAVFEHPILMGVSCGSLLALVHLVLGRDKPPAGRWARSMAVAFTAALSLSSGPWGAMALQAGLIGWNWLLRAFAARWKLLIAAIAAVIGFVELFAARPLPEIIFSAFAFDRNTAYYRILIWDYGTQSVMNHPWFGVGHGEWDRPAWMPASIDMYWLYNALLYGLPAGLLMLAGFFGVVFATARASLSGRLYDFRAGFLISMAAFFIEGWMVHFWGATHVLFMLLLGSGMWFADAGASGITGTAARSRAARTRRREPVISGKGTSAKADA